MIFPGLSHRKRESERAEEVGKARGMLLQNVNVLLPLECALAMKHRSIPSIASGQSLSPGPIQRTVCRSASKAIKSLEHTRLVLFLVLCKSNRIALHDRFVRPSDI